VEQDVIDKLEADLDRSRVKVKKIQGRPDADYLETYDVINRANAIFGYGGWGTTIINIDMVPVDGKTVCIATVQLDVGRCLPRQDVGVVVSAGDSPQALETAAKGAVSDGIKRNFRHFGKQFGNDLYAKEKPTAKDVAAYKAQGHPKESEEKPRAKPCPLHPNEELLLHRNEATGAEWYSHKDGDVWCRGE